MHAEQMPKHNLKVSQEFYHLCIYVCVFKFTYLVSPLFTFLQSLHVSPPPPPPPLIRRLSLSLSFPLPFAHAFSYMLYRERITSQVAPFKMKEMLWSKFSLIYLTHACIINSSPKHGRMLWLPWYIRKEIHQTSKTTDQSVCFPLCTRCFQTFYYKGWFVRWTFTNHVSKPDLEWVIPR